MEGDYPLRYGDVIQLEMLIAGEDNPLEGATAPLCAWKRGVLGPTKPLRR
jgi:hypothetical protein